jgi:hypothetical protein
MRLWRADCAFPALALWASAEMSERVAGRRMTLSDIAYWSQGIVYDIWVQESRY